MNKDSKKTIFESVSHRHTTGMHSYFGPMHVLFMRSTRCAYGGKCQHCSFWFDNSKTTEQAEQTNTELIHHLITLDFPKLPTIMVNPSASWFDIPSRSRYDLLNALRASRLMVENGFNILTESTWDYRERYAEEKAMIEERGLGQFHFYHKMGLESFDDFVRAKIGKDYVIGDWRNVVPYTKCWTLLVGTKYHSKYVTDRDINILLEHCEIGEVNVIDDRFAPTPMADQAMVDYTLDKWGDVLKSTPKVQFTLTPEQPWETTIKARG